MTEYDPFSHEAMSDPHPIYKRLRAEGCPHFIKERRAWAITLFDDLKRASLAAEWLDFTAGQTPGQLMLGEPSPHTFMTMNAPENRKWRGILEPHYSQTAARNEAPRLQELVKSVLANVRGREAFDVYQEYANKVLCLNAGYNLGFDQAQSLRARDLIDRMILHREKGQVGGGSPVNAAAGQELSAMLFEHVQRIRSDPGNGGPHGRLLVEAEIDGQRLSDQDLWAYLFSLLVTGSETTPMAVAGAFYYLNQKPDQKRAVLADHALSQNLFREACRYDQPTNMLARRAAKDFELNGAHVKSGDNLLFIYASANRDERQFSNADDFDIFRDNRNDLSFGVGSHFCLGVHLARVVGNLLIAELLDAIHDYQVVEAECERAYGEHLNGFVRMIIRPEWR